MLKVSGKLTIDFQQSPLATASPPLAAPGASPPTPPAAPHSATPATPPVAPPGVPPAPRQAAVPGAPGGNLSHQLGVMAAVADSLDEYQVEQRVHRQNTLCLFSRQFMSDLKHLQDRLDMSESRN